MKILHINSTWIYSWAENVYRFIYNNLWWEKISIDDYIFKNKYLKFFNKFLFSFTLFYKVKNTIKNYNPDVILIHWIDYSPFPVLLWVYWHKNVVQIVHDATQAWCPSAWTIYRKNYWKCDIKMNYFKCLKNCAYDKSKIAFFVYYFWLKMFLFLKRKIIRKYISPSISLKKILLNNNFNNVEVLLNTIDYKYLEQDIRKENILLFVGSIDKRKWIDKLLEAVDELDILKENWKFIIIWNWEILDELKEKYTDNFYNFLGKIDNSDVLEYCKKSKILFVPSILFESFWLVALEWVLNDNIVLWNNIWWIPEIITEFNTFNILDKNSIKNKILDVIDNYNDYYSKSQIQKKIFLDNNHKYFEKLKKIMSE